MKTGPWGAILTAPFRTSVWQGREGQLLGGMRTFSPIPERLFARTRRRGLEILFATTPDVRREHATATGAANGDKPKIRNRSRRHSRRVTRAGVLVHSAGLNLPELAC